MNKKSRNTKSLSRRLVVLLLCCVCLFTMTPMPAIAQDAAEEPVIGESIAELQPETMMDADSLFERLMACSTFEEMEAAINALSEEEQALMDQFTEEQNAALEAKTKELGGYDAEPLAEYTFTIAQGESQNVTVSNIKSNGFNASCSQSGITATRTSSGYTIKVDAEVPTGEYTLSVSYRAGNGYGTNYSHTITLVVIPKGKVPVHVYVSSQDSNGNSWKDNEEFQELIGLYVCDANGYFPAGTIYLDASYFNGKANANTTNTGLINNANDWKTLLKLLSGMDNTNLSGSLGAASSSNGKTLDFTNNNGNKVNEYLSQAEEIYDQIWGSQHTALFRWHDIDDANNVNIAHLGHPGDTTTKYHLDLCFNINTIKFICGNNGITQDISQEAYDGLVVDSRAYIKGSLIQPPRNLKIPEGYRLVGYYTDADFNTPWDGIGTPLNEDQTVYIKITEKENIVLNYKVAMGQGTVDPDNEAFNPDKSPKGSTAAPAEGWEFDGWYADQECTELVDNELHYTPTEPADGWVSVSGTTYWAKFVEKKVKLTIKKTVSGNMQDTNKAFAFTVSANKDMTIENETGISLSFYLKNGETKIISVPVGATVTVSENADGYTRTIGADTTITGYTDLENGISFTMPDADSTVVFNNEKNITIDGGVLLDTLPYVLILAIVAAGAVLFIKKRRHYEGH